MTTHLEVIKEHVSRDVSIIYQEGDKVETKGDCRILHLDGDGVTFIDKNKLGKNRVTFIPTFKLIMIRQEIF